MYIYLKDKYRKDKLERRKIGYLQRKKRVGKCGKREGINFKIKERAVETLFLNFSLR